MTGKRYRLTALPMDVIGLLRLYIALPLIETTRRNKAAPGLVRGPECRLGGDGLRPRIDGVIGDLLIHGHPPLTDFWTIEALPGLEAALRELHDRTLKAIVDGIPVAEAVQQSDLPVSLRDQPAAIVSYVVMRENFIKRLYDQRTGYWKPDGEGIETFTTQEWASALSLLAGREENAFVRTAKMLLEQGDYALALRMTDLGLVTYPTSQPLSELRLNALHRLRGQHQQLNPFKFIVYSEWAGVELPPVE